MIFETPHRVLFVDMPFLKEDFNLKDLEFNTIKKNMHVHNCLITNCVVPMKNILSNGYAVANFIFEKYNLNANLIQITFIIHFNEMTTKENYVEKIEIATKENKSLIIKAHLSYNYFMLRSSKVIENSYEFLVEFYKIKSQIKLSEEEAAKTSSMLSIKKEYPVKFNHMILGYEEIDIFLSNMNVNSNKIMNNLLDEISKLKIKYLYKR